MHRTVILERLAAHVAADAEEAADIEWITAFVRANANCFGRTNPQAHITGSAFVIDPAGRALLTHHAKLDRWLQVGGHSEPHEHDPWQTALREATEESGLDDLRLLSQAPIDIDAHRIPARKAEAAHQHLDFRYLLRTQKPESTIVSEESHDLRWFTMAELVDMPFDDALHRAVRRL